MQSVLPHVHGAFLRYYPALFNKDNGVTKAPHEGIKDTVKGAANRARRPPPVPFHPLGPYSQGYRAAAAGRGRHPIGSPLRSSRRIHAFISESGAASDHTGLKAQPAPYCHSKRCILRVTPSGTGRRGRIRITGNNTGNREVCGGGVSRRISGYFTVTRPPPALPVGGGACKPCPLPSALLLPPKLHPARGRSYEIQRRFGGSAV